MSTEEILRTEFSNSSTEDLRSSADSSSDHEATDSSTEAIAPVTPAVVKKVSPPSPRAVSRVKDKEHGARRAMKQAAVKRGDHPWEVRGSRASLRTFARKHDSLDIVVHRNRRGSIKHDDDDDY